MAASARCPAGADLGARRLPVQHRTPAAPVLRRRRAAGGAGAWRWPPSLWPRWELHSGAATCRLRPASVFKSSRQRARLCRALPLNWRFHPTAPGSFSSPSRSMASDGSGCAGSMTWRRASIAGTEDARHPFWSPDGRSIGFFARDKLVRIDENGGARQVLCDAPSPGGGSWSPQGTILFGANLVLNRVAATGGAATPVTSRDESRMERSHVWPAFLPDGRRFLYVSLSRDGAQSGIYRGAIDASVTERVLAGTTAFALAGDRLLSLNNRSLIVRRIRCRSRAGHRRARAAGQGRRP